MVKYPEDAAIGGVVKYMENAAQCSVLKYREPEMDILSGLIYISVKPPGLGIGRGCASGKSCMLSRVASECTMLQACERPALRHTDSVMGRLLDARQASM